MPKAVGGRKLCTGCGLTKEATAEWFPRSDMSADGLRSNCRLCQRARDKADYDANPGRARAHSQKYRDTHPEKYKAGVRASHWRRRTERLADGKRRYSENREARLLSAKEYRDANRDKVIETQRKWRVALKIEMHAAYGGKCNCCGETESKFLTLEHVGQTGGAHRKLMGGQVQIYCDLRKRGWPKSGFTLLCWNCNLSTRDGSLCPHEIGRRALICEPID